MTRCINKIIFFFIPIVLILFPLKANAIDCSDYQFLSHKYNMCKLGKLKEKTIGSKKEKTSTELNYSSETKKSTKEKVAEAMGKVKKSPLGGFLKKIKNFGGKNIGEAG